MMFFHLLKKDLLQLSRNRKELVILLMMPLILISILGFALSGMMNSEDQGGLIIEVAVLDEGTLDDNLTSFAETMSDIGIPEEQKYSLLSQAENLSIPDLFIQQLESADMNDLFQLTVVNNEEQLNNIEGTHAHWEFSESYRLETWKQMFLRSDGKVSPVKVVLDQNAGLRGDVVLDYTEGFYNQLNFSKEIGYLFFEDAIDFSAFGQSTPTFGETVQDQDLSPVSSFDYYAIGMAVMFVLYSATFIASSAFSEKESHVFDRIIIANTNSIVYGMSKWASGTLLGFMQMMILFIVSYFLYDVQFPNISLFLVVSLMMSIAVGALSVLLTSINFRMNHIQFTNLFSSGIVTIMAFLGGSFIEVQAISETFWQIGGWIPNGASLQSYLSIMRGGDLSLILPAMRNILIFTLVTLIIAIAIFPKRSGR